MQFSFNLGNSTLSKVKHENRSLKNSIVNTMKEKQLLIEGGRFEYYNFAMLLRTCKSLTSEQFSVKRNYKKDIIFDIIHLSFPHLTILNISINNITCLEPLCHLDAPQVKNLNLSQNRLLSTKLLRKLPFKLDRLDICNFDTKKLAIQSLKYRSSNKYLSIRIFSFYNYNGPRDSQLQVKQLLPSSKQNAKKQNLSVNIKQSRYKPQNQHKLIHSPTSDLQIRPNRDFPSQKMIDYDLDKQLQNKMNKVVQNYILKQKIGQGQYGNVFRAEHNTQPGNFAAKVMNLDKFKQAPKLQEFTNNQIAILGKIDHPNIIKLVEVLRTNTHFFLIYQFCDSTLEQLIQKKGKLSEKEALEIFYSLREAFIILYKSNILHRDLKPSNILFKNGIIKIADFGFCKELLKQNDMTQTMVGSPIYMAPQILKGQPYDAKADIWSLGVILYEMLYGVCPYMQNSIPKLISLIDNHVIPYPQNVNVSEETILFIKKILVLNAQYRIDPYMFIDYKLSMMEQKSEVTYTQAGKYIRKALIYMTQTLQQLTQKIEELPYLRVAFLVYKIIRTIQDDTTGESVFWDNLGINIKGQFWEDIIMREIKIARPYGQITREVLKKYDTGLKTKVQLETKLIDARFFLQSVKKLEDQDQRYRLLNCFLFNRHFTLIKQKRPSKWIDPSNDYMPYKQKQQICTNYAKYY